MYLAVIKDEIRILEELISKLGGESSDNVTPFIHGQLFSLKQLLRRIDDMES